MNRIRRVGPTYQVLITPSIKVSPDDPLPIGNWDDDEIRNYYILEFDTLRDAQCEALKHPDIDWYRLVVNHKYIFKRLETNLKEITDNMGFTVEFQSHLMDPETLKNTMFDKVVNDESNFSTRFGMNNIISFTIINPWTKNLQKISKSIENTRSHVYRDDLRIRSKRIMNNKVIVLDGLTELGTVYEIKLMPTLIYHYGEWYKKTGFLKPEQAEKLFQETIMKQNDLDISPIR